MSKKLVIQHDLQKLTAEELEQYKRDVSVYIGLDPDLNGLDTIWMQNEGGPGQSLVLYARRGTAEILREIYGIQVSSLTHVITAESAVLTATGINNTKRQEIAIGSKSLRGLQGKAYDSAVMTASTRALRRLTMQFTKLGILDESEIESIQGSTVNPAAGATLVGTPMVIPPMPKLTNNAPGKDVTQIADESRKAAQEVNDAYNKKIHDDAAAFLAAKADKKADTAAPFAPTSPAVAPVMTEIEAAKQAAPKRTRKPRNTISLDGPEPEVVSKTAAPIADHLPEAPEVKRIEHDAPPISVPAVGPDPVQSVAPPQTSAPEPAPVQVTPAPVVISATPVVEGLPTKEQMDEYRKKVGTYTAELQSSENMGSVQKMRAFITKMSGTAPQFMTTDQWDEILAWFSAFVEKNAVKGLVKYINDSLGTK